MAKNAIKAVDSGELKIIPEHHVKIWHHWMDNMRYYSKYSFKIKNILWLCFEFKDFSNLIRIRPFFQAKLIFIFITIDFI